MRRTPVDLVVEAVEHVDAVRAHVDRLGLDDPAGFDAACLRLAAAIDCLSGLPAGLRDEICGGDWHSVRSTRNRIVHGYFAVESEVVREALVRDLEPLRARLLAAAEVIDGTA
ncbi:HepT-like ribonuclease domain-containing protein [Cellulomonas sp. PS-H5]|uniref:HepT-like ribonuclease domain-containing protein n=1 Tax=Cellulomonas sp. PS-H5 TaxID=2820400 RepID=UPI001C4E354F|nr:HepT-like ribonuclease domain-containing protein [Cellulomonas sp. PS-H5]MBW0255685.1 DUF86 domain-containing protein [Cellulomonas sp. PS-H5]